MVITHVPGMLDMHDRQLNMYDINIPKYIIVEKNINITTRLNA